ncbi:MAG: GNAT family N-acetyltransferase [Kiritimatiellae bacterium]|nr:GNAT family N-acetyltransferase [Kiritimatiellia bacterium]MDD5523306.1 GNAT family N-acetyltransferase [Kiritimatiellia bacterium]
MSDFKLRSMNAGDRSEVAELIYLSTNSWYVSHGRPPIFSGDPMSADIFFDVYEALDPGCGLVVEHTRTKRVVGSCFVHPRPTHIALGIMNSHPNYAGRGIARLLLKHIVDEADRLRLPLRLVSSALNLDSFSLYTRAGFVARRIFQDMYLAVPSGGLNVSVDVAGTVRDAKPGDVGAMVALEKELVGLDRAKDFAYFIKNAWGFWHVSVIEGDNGIDGFLVSCGHSGLNMFGPGVTRREEQTAALILRELNQYRGRHPLFLVPVDCGNLVRMLYDWGARNCELHVSQVRGEALPSKGIVMPTFLPETA